MAPSLVELEMKRRCERRLPPAAFFKPIDRRAISIRPGFAMI
jgi:hypothetical protein